MHVCREIFLRQSASPVHLLLHRRRVVFDESDLVQAGVHACIVQVHLERARESFFRLAEAIETHEARTQSHMPGGNVWIEVHGLASFRDRLIELAQHQVSPGKIARWSKVIRVGSLIDFQRFDRFVQIAHGGNIVVVGNVELLSIADAILQRISASGVLRRMTWLREDNVVAGEQHVGISKIGIEFGGAPEQRHRFKVLAFVRAIESQ